LVGLDLKQESKEEKIMLESCPLRPGQFCNESCHWWNAQFERKGRCVIWDISESLALIVGQLDRR
jgi:hypothetical protein